MANKILYIRVSSAGQNTDRQEVNSESYDKVFIDRCSGKDRERPQLKEMLNYLREGDTLEVHSFDRLARSTTDLLNLVSEIEEKGVKLISRKENLDTSTANGKLQLTMLGAIAEFERAMIKERQLEGIEAAQKKGVKFGRQAIEITPDMIEVFQQYKVRDMSAKNAMTKLELKKTTFYKLFNKWNDK